jgi:DNA-binding SARP family transcriptional activator
VEIRLLGPVEVRAAGLTVEVGGPNVRALLALLALRPHQVVTVEQITDALWDGRPPAAARQSVHYLVHRLRRALAGHGGQVVTRAGGYELACEPDGVDLERFERLVARAEAARRADDPAGAATWYDQALRLWRGEPLADLAAWGFAQAEAARLRELRDAAREEAIEVRLALGDHEQLLGELEALVRVHPLRERLRGQLMLAMYRSGRADDALEVYRAARHAHIDEPSAEPNDEPGPELQRLEQAVLARDPAIDLPGPASEERRAVTVLVASLTGTGPAQLDGLARLRRQVERFGGLVEAAAGGTALAVFGVPAARDDDPERAVRAALAFVDELAQKAAVTGDGLLVRVGIDTGEAQVSMPGTSLPEAGHDGRVGVAGTVTELAQTLRSVAEPGTVLVGAAVERASRQVIDYRPLGGRQREPAGADPAPAPAWVALRTRARGPGAGGPVAGTPLLERAGDLELLTRLLDRTRRERRPALVTVLGPAGIGKRRLVAELARTVDEDPELVTWRAGRPPPYGDEVTFWALGEVVKAQAGVHDADSAEEAGAKLDRAAADLIDEQADAAWVARHLRHLVAPDTPAPGAERRVEAFAAWRRFLTALAAQRPLVVALEDVHRAADAMLDFVEELIERAAGVALLVVATARPELLERRPGWGGRGDASRLTLAPLSETGTGRLLDVLLGASVLPQATRAAVVAGAGGLPLFVEEYVRLLRDLGTGGEWSRAARASRGGGQPALPVPETLQHLVAARLDALDPDAKALVRQAAVLGGTVWASGLAAVAGVDLAAVETGLGRLERRALLRRAPTSSVPGEAEWGFSHDLVREAAYGQLPEAELAERHARAAAWIQSLGRGRTDGAEPLAHHWRRALESTRAIGGDADAVVDHARQALRAAGDRAAGLTAYQAAARFYAAAVELCPADEPDRPALLLRLSETARFGAGADPGVLAEGRDGLLATGRADQAALAEVLLAELAGRQGRVEDADAHLDRAVELADGAPPSWAKAAVLARVAARLAAGERRERAVELGGQARQVAAALGLDHLEALSLQAVGLARARLGDPTGLADQERAAELLEALRAPEAEVALDNLGTLRKWLGDLRAGRAAQAAGRRAAERFGTSSFEQAWTDHERAADCFSTGRWAEARRILEPLIANPAAGPAHDFQAPMRCIRGRILLACGDLAGARAEAEAALASSSAGGDRQLRDPALSLGARVLLAAGDRDGAAALLDELLGSLAGRLVISEVGVDLPLVMAGLGRPAGQLDEAGILPSRWLEAARALLAGDERLAAERYARIGSFPDEAEARLRAATRLLAEGRAAEAAAEAAAARSFLVQAGAAGLLAQAQAVLAEASGAVPASSRNSGAWSDGLGPLR